METQNSKAVGCLTIIIFGVAVFCFRSCWSGDTENSSLTYEQQQAVIQQKTQASVDSLVASNKQKMISEGLSSPHSQEYDDSVWFLSFKKENPKAFRLHKKYPDWMPEECEAVAKGEIWVGMTYEMLVTERGKPNHIVTSNYGDDNEYQACWDNYDTSCFYFGDDHIITAYN